MGFVANTARRLKTLFQDHNFKALAWVLLWYSCAAVCVVSSKLFMQKAPKHVGTLSMCQNILGVCITRLWIELDPNLSMAHFSREQKRLAFAEGFFYWAGFICTNIALKLMNANIVETIKATEPVPTVIIATVFVGEAVASVRELFGLSVVVAGVMLAAYADGSVLLTGVLATLGSNICFASTNNIVKLAMGLPGKVDAVNFFHRALQFSVVCGTPRLLWELFVAEGAKDAWASLLSMAPLLFLNATACTLYNQACFALTQYVNMTTHSLLNTMRRGTIVVVTTVFFGNEVSMTNTVGCGVAAVGFTYYLFEKDAKAKAEPAAEKAV